MNYKKIFLISFLIALVFFALSWLSLYLGIGMSTIGLPWLLIWGNAFQGGKQGDYLVIGFFAVFWLISLILTTLFFIIKNRKTT